MAMQLQFGFYPRALDFKVGDVSVATLGGMDDAVRCVTESGHVERGWCYAPSARSKDFMSGAVRTLPYSERVFGLPQTHVLEHTTAPDAEHLSFLVWVLGFILGVRLTETEAGFLDATPIEPGALHDIVWTGRSEQKALEIADRFWRSHAANPRITKGVTGIIHSLFLSQTPTYLCFEEFIYLYTALDACHFVHSLTTGQNPRDGGHAKRITNLCGAFNCPIPAWADIQSGTIAKHRNETLHEGLFFDEPLGFRIFGGAPPSNAPAAYGNALLEMRVLVCRFVCAILGFNDASYITSPVNTRHKFGVRL